MVNTAMATKLAHVRGPESKPYCLIYALNGHAKFVPPKEATAHVQSMQRE
jgi:hypothetical protein